MDEIERVRIQMEAAAEALDFEQARRLRDQLALLRGGASAAEAAEAETVGLIRQQPGAMGLGTSQQRMTPPPGWKKPVKPDPMTKGRSRKR
ncbi:UvrB/UvrC motif-containing protein [Sphingomonas sp. UYEF23]|uniref:UvrB/UvrC motif-containing protein n=1 Tax=Sphingomonas sp. UYEF23 TaxID=1756408 RepID=UPI003399C9C9